MLQVFPEALLLQLLNSMMHPDAVTRIGVHRILAVILVPTSYHRYDCTSFQSEYFERRRWQSKTSSAFASATALLEKLRREECIKTERHVNNAPDEFKDREIDDEDGKHGWVRKSSPNFCKINCSIIDQAAASTSESDAVSISLPFSKPSQNKPQPPCVALEFMVPLDVLRDHMARKILV